MKISIIIPTFNRAQYLKECFDSIMKQNFHAYEVILVDDNSQDSTLDFCESQKNVFQKKQISLVILKSDKNNGAQVARNRGIKACSGTHLMFMDSDDVLKNDALQKFKNAFEKNKVDFVYSQVIKTSSDLTPLSSQVVGARYNQNSKELSGYHWQTMGAVYTRELIEKVGLWNEALTGSQDWEYQARVKIHARSSFFINEVLAYWRQHDGERVGTSKFRADYIQSVILACESIRAHAKKYGLNNATLEWSLAKRLCLHALEYKINDSKNYNDVSRIISTYKQLNWFQRILLNLLIKLPKPIASIFWQRCVK
ncbi:glycosyltransferase family A protein [Lentisphaera marina]|uniref:glycosyltransferase family 2 protein n=1 Tax=Lentisphaera marina TaxID=1111041 RepID=UPI00236653B3|nr:glycosyltransferase family A protein [Lentisphaera marina]MDD7986900.1 glycosyltransferase family A protein [Lentisphaera marina]